jgi:hypothetical protein
MKRMLQIIGVMVALVTVGSATPVMIDHFSNPAGNFDWVYWPGHLGTSLSGTGTTQSGVSAVGGARQFTGYGTGTSIVQMVANSAGTGDFSLGALMPGTKGGAVISWSSFPGGVVDLTGGGTQSDISLGITGMVGVVYEVTLFNGGVGYTASFSTTTGSLNNYSLQFTDFVGLNPTAVTGVQVTIAGGSVPQLTGGYTSLDYIGMGIPEPGTFALAGIALVGLGLLTRRRK